MALDVHARQGGAVFWPMRRLSERAGVTLDNVGCSGHGNLAGCSHSQTDVPCNDVGTSFYS